MVDWWGFFRNSLWILGLAVCLAALSMANYRARCEEIHLRKKLGEVGFQSALSIGMMSFCLGLLFSSRTWWERAIWGMLSLLLAGQLAWLGRRVQADGTEAIRPSLALLAASYRRLQGTRRLGWGLILAGLLIIGGWGTITGTRLLSHGRSLQAHLQYLEGLTSKAGGQQEVARLKSAGEHLSGMHKDLEAIQSAIAPLLPAGRLLRWLPEYGGDLAAAADLLDMATGMAVAGDRAFQALAPALDVFEDSADDSAPHLSVGEQLLPMLVTAQPELLAVKAQLAAVVQTRSRVDAQTLSPRVASFLERMDRYLPWFETAIDGALLAPSLLGVDGPRSYLLVAQNNQELRATGGFMSGVALLKVDQGLLSPLSFEDSYAVDNLEVPHELTTPDFQHVLGGQLWFFRDTNWDAHFPASAQRALDVYARDRGIQADGLITLDLTALQLLVDAVSLLQVEGIPGQVTGQNVLQVIQEQWAEPSAGSDQDWWLHRKDFMGQIAGAAMQRLMTGRNLRALNLVRALREALDEKHILIYLTDPQATALLRERNWDGALTIPALPSDTLLVVDSNVGFNKVDAVIARSIHYQVDLASDEGPRARLTLTYEHLEPSPAEVCIQESRYSDAYTDMMKRCYWDYVRVYVPGGSQLLQGPNLPLPPGSLLLQSSGASQPEPITPTLSENGWAVWTTFFDLPTFEQRTLTFEYQLPEGLVDHDTNGLAHYRLRVQKQPGTEAVPLWIEITLPPGAELVATTPASPPAWDTDLRTDRQFEVVYHGGEKSP